MKTTRRQIDEEDLRYWESHIEENLYPESDVEQLQKELKEAIKFQRLTFTNTSELTPIDILNINKIISYNIDKVFNNFTGK